ncbi:hypothetical protein GCM10010313_39680 [Streptomyces violarus]|nr:hypothetical protein GCM10010313_39680 [Streptomyces violarus]
MEGGAGVLAAVRRVPGAGGAGDPALQDRAELDEGEKRDRRRSTRVDRRLADRTWVRERAEGAGGYFVGFLPVTPRCTNSARFGFSSACFTPQEVKPF